MRVICPVWLITLLSFWDFEWHWIILTILIIDIQIFHLLNWLTYSIIFIFDHILIKSTFNLFNLIEIKPLMFKNFCLCRFAYKNKIILLFLYFVIDLLLALCVELNFELRTLTQHTTNYDLPTHLLNYLLTDG